MRGGFDKQMGNSHDVDTFIKMICDMILHEMWIYTLQYVIDYEIVFFVVDLY